MATSRTSCAHSGSWKSMRITADIAASATAHFTRARARDSGLGGFAALALGLVARALRLVGFFDEVSGSIVVLRCR